MSVHDDEARRIAEDRAFAELEKCGGDVAKLPHVLRTIVIVCTAQAIIDNGGLQYFFEADFANQPPYSLTIDAYRAIGANDAADALASAVELFPFPDPHLFKDERNRVMDSFKDEEGEPVNSPFEELSDKLVGHREVWEAYEQFILHHRNDIENAR